MKSSDFVRLFRQSAPYVHAHRERTFVVCFFGELMDTKAFVPFLHDVALLRALGVKLVLVHGARPQIEERLRAFGRPSRFARQDRLTSREDLPHVIDAVSSARTRIEAALSMGLPNSPMENARIRVSTGNFVVAQPLGVIDGQDAGYTGTVRRIDREAIEDCLLDGSVALLSPLGYSVTGEVFNVSAVEIASQVAIALHASKLIYLVPKNLLRAGDGLPGQLPPAGARQCAGDFPPLSRVLLASAEASEKGVKRAHILDSEEDGALLSELFTHRGSGTMVVSEPFPVRAARASDVGGLLALLEPLADEGILLHRPRSLIEQEIDHFRVIEQDGLIIACAALVTYGEEGKAEFSALAVAPEYRTAGHGERLLKAIEREAESRGMEQMVALTTASAHWFRERGYRTGKLGDLPKKRRATYDKKRGSLVLTKRLSKPRASKIKGKRA